MGMWWRRIRAAIVMGLLWAFAWSFGGFVLARIPGFFSDLPFAIIFAPLGFITGVIFSGLLVAISGRGRAAHISIARFTGWGALSGLGLTAMIVAGAAYRGAPLMSEFLLFGPALTTAAALCAGGSLALAQRAERQALGAGAGQVGAIDRVTDGEG